MELIEFYLKNFNLWLKVSFKIKLQIVKCIGKYDVKLFIFEICFIGKIILQ